MEKRAADVLDKVAREEMLSGHGGASLCSGGALGFLRKSPEMKGKSVREGEEWKGAPRAFSWRRDGDVEALGQAGGGSPRRHARHASARRQRLKTPLPLAGWAGFGGQLGQVGRGVREGVSGLWPFSFSNFLFVLFFSVLFI